MTGGQSDCQLPGYSPSPLTFPPFKLFLDVGLLNKQGFIRIQSQMDAFLKYMPRTLLFRGPKSPCCSLPLNPLIYMWSLLI